MFMKNGKGLGKQTNKESSRCFQRAKAVGKGIDTDPEQSSLQQGVRRHQNIVALQCENDHDMKTFTENKMYFQNKYMANLQQYKSAVESVGLWKSLYDKPNELKAITDVLQYRDEKEVLEQ